LIFSFGGIGFRENLDFSKSGHTRWSVHYSDFTVQYTTVSAYESIAHTCAVNGIVIPKNMKLTSIRFFTLFLLVLSLPVAAQEEASTKTSPGNSDRTHRYRTSTGLTDFNIEYRGTIEVTDDDRDISYISDDGYLEISKTVFGSKRAIIIESLGGGRMKKEYYEGRSKQNWEPGGRQWLADILPDIVRTTTVGANSRVNRFYNKGGANAVINEIRSIKSDHVKAHYGKLLLDKSISNNELPSVITGLCNSINSDYYLANLLQTNIDKLLVTREAGDAFFRGTQNISSDYYKSQVLKSALDKYASSPEQVKIILESASTINSDYYLSTVLTSVLNKAEVKEESLKDIARISGSINSAYYSSQVLSKMLDKHNISKSVVVKIVESAANVSSDYYKSTVLKKLSDQADLDEVILNQVLTITGNSVNSDHYASTVLQSVVRNQKLSDENFKKLIAAITRIGSDHYTAEVLQEASSQPLTKSQIISICKGVECMGSDYYKSTVLVRLAPQVKGGDKETKEAYRQDAKRISSETYYGRALRAID